MKVDRRTFIAGAAASALPMPAIAKFADPESAEQLYEYLLRMCICSDGQAAACHVVDERGSWVPEDGVAIYSIPAHAILRVLPYHVRIHTGEKEEGVEINSFCATEAEAVRQWLANFRKDAEGATHIVWRVRPYYEWITERWQPYKQRVPGKDGYDWVEAGFQRVPDFVPGGVIYSRLWFGRL